MEATSWREQTLDRRSAGGVFVAVMASFFIRPFFRPAIPTDLVPSWDIDAARAAAKEGALCPTVSCSDVAFARVQAALDTSGLQANAIGSAKDCKPIVYVEAAFGMRRDVSMARYKVVAVAPLPRESADRVLLFWLKDATTGRVIAIRSFDDKAPTNPFGQELETWPPTLAASLKEPYVGVRRGEAVIPMVYYAKAGLWQGEAFTLCGPEAGTVCGGSGLFSALDIPTDNRKGAAYLGARLLEAARPQQ